MLRLTQKFGMLRRPMQRLSVNRFASSSSITDAPDQEEQLAGQASTKLPPRLPLAKNFFVGLVDNELLAFPEVINREDMAILRNELLPLQNFYTEDFNNQVTTLPKDLPENLTTLGLYGLNVSTDFDGKGWGYSQSLIACEPESQNTDVALSLLGHRAIIDVIQELGTDEQKSRFLPKLANGEKLDICWVFNKFIIL